MTTLEICALFLAALIAGIVNAVAGGGSLISFPTLLMFHVPSVSANATNAVATWPGLLSSAWGYRKMLMKYKTGLITLALLSVAGGALGAMLVMMTPKAMFALATPMFILIAFLFFALGPMMARKPSAPADNAASATDTQALYTPKRKLLQFIATSYAGYFPSGGGMVIMALYNSFGIRDAQLINAIKCLLGVTVSGTAVMTFVLSGQVLWPQAVIMIIGSLVGGFAGARLAQTLNPRLMRRIMLVLGGVITAFFFHKYYTPLLFA